MFKQSACGLSCASIETPGVMGPGLRRDDVRYLLPMTSRASNTLQDISGPIVLAGAGKMGGAMLAGWLAQGLDARLVGVIEPHPSDDIRALAAKGIRLNRSHKDIGGGAAPVGGVGAHVFPAA